LVTSLKIVSNVNNPFGVGRDGIGCARMGSSVSDQNGYRP
jgi:hypothetical protein